MTALMDLDVTSTLKIGTRPSPGAITFVWTGLGACAKTDATASTESSVNGIAFIVLTSVGEDAIGAPGMCRAARLLKAMALLAATISVELAGTGKYYAERY